MALGVGGGVRAGAVGIAVSVRCLKGSTCCSVKFGAMLLGGKLLYNVLIGAAESGGDNHPAAVFCGVGMITVGM